MLNRLRFARVQKYCVTSDSFCFGETGVLRIIHCFHQNKFSKDRQQGEEETFLSFLRKLQVAG